MKSCVYCSKQRIAEFAYCPYCGKEQNPKLACPKCKYINRSNSRFCGKCGCPLSKESQPEVIVTEPVPQFPDMCPESRTQLVDSVIDVTDHSFTLPTPNKEVTIGKYLQGVPFWPHFYVYSASEIEFASRDQKAFYHYFKNAFLNGQFLDIEENSNYAFILLFDLVDLYDAEGDLAKLEKNLHYLGQVCPKTKPYCRELLSVRMAAINDEDGLIRLKHRQIDDEYWTFGGKFRRKLNLSYEEAALLNKLSYPTNKFVDIEYCCIEVIKLYLATVRKLEVEYRLSNTTSDAEVSRVADIVARKHFRYRSGSYNYHYCIQSISSEIYSIIFKHCENAVRQKYGHKRKLNTEINYSSEAKAEIESRLISKIVKIIEVEAQAIKPPNEQTEIRLNAQNTNRWKSTFHELTADKNINGKQFVDTLLRLGNLNKRNPSLENIFFEGSKYISKTDKVAALSLYVYYLYYDLQSAKFDNKKLTRTIQKNLFETNEQLHEFERVISELIFHRNIEKALSAVSQVYLTKRKQIKLSRDAIKEVQHKHSDTVGLLNEYLRDEFEDEQNAIVSKEINSDEVQIEITTKRESAIDPEHLCTVELNPTQLELLRLFAKNNFILPLGEVETFAKSNGLFRNQLIESINSACYEVLDDVLIEEEDEDFITNEDYFSAIIKI